MKINCYQCNFENSFSENKILRQDDCEGCSADLHCCKMCGFYDQSAYNECREPMAERIVDKEKANYCDFFKPNTGSNANDKADDMLAKANALFKD